MYMNREKRYRLRITMSLHLLCLFCHTQQKFLHWHAVQWNKIDFLNKHVLVCGWKVYFTCITRHRDENTCLALVRSAAVPGFEQSCSCFSYHTHRFTLSGKHKGSLCLLRGTLERRMENLEGSANQKNPDFFPEDLLPIAEMF